METSKPSAPPTSTPSSSPATAGCRPVTSARACGSSGSDNTNNARILTTTREAHPEGIRVYNFEVTGDHTYFVEDGTAAQTAVWVHNQCRDPVKRGDAGSFGELDARRVAGDGLTPHHMPQDALHVLPRSEGGAIAILQSEHILTRTYGIKGVATARAESGIAFRTALGRDLRDLRRIAGKQYDVSIRSLLDYYRTSVPELMKRTKR